MEKLSPQPFNGDLGCVLAKTSDLEDLIRLQYEACEGYDFHEAIWGVNTTHNRQQSEDRLRQKWQQTPNLRVVKCLDSRTGALMAWCIWDAIPATLSHDEAVQEDIMTNCDWLQGEARALARAHLIPAIHKRWEIMKGRAYMLLTNLCTAPEHRGRGAARALVQWGLDEAKQMGIPAYCEASDMSLELYGKIGFKQVGVVESRLNGVLVDESPVLVAEQPTE